MELKNILSR